MKTLDVNELDQKFYSLISDTKPDLFLEIGSFNAQTSCKVKKLVPECRVIAYEANPYNYDMFKDTLPSNIEFNNLAISDYVGKTTFYVQLTNNGRIMPKTKKNNSILERTESNVHYEHVTVSVDKIDHMFSNEYNNIAMWIDVEGVGYEVLVGAKSILEKTSLIKIEVESKQFWKDQVIDNKIIDFLHSQGFTSSFRDEEYTNQYNIIFTKDIT